MNFVCLLYTKIKVLFTSHLSITEFIITCPQLTICFSREGAVRNTLYYGANTFSVPVAFNIIT